MDNETRWTVVLVALRGVTAHEIETAAAVAGWDMPIRPVAAIDALRPLLQLIEQETLAHRAAELEDRLRAGAGDELLVGE
jgi:chromosome condensin MukBEF ATPase and DNA-binding subunit MukB